MLIDCSYFTSGPRHIQNATLGRMPNANSTAVNEAIESYIAEHQEMYLIRTLGRTLGNKVNTYLVCADEDDAPVHNDAIDALCGKLRDSFADYVFYQILRDTNTQSTMTGLVRLKCANPYVAPIRRQVSVWNSMVDKHRLFREWCDSSECTLSKIVTSDDMLTKINALNL